MKTPQYHLARILGSVALAGFLTTSSNLCGQDLQNGQAPATPQPGCQAAQATPAAKQMRPMARQMRELIQAGKYDEARQLAEKMRAAAKNNPQAMGFMHRGQGQWQQKLDAAQQQWMAPNATTMQPRTMGFMQRSQGVRQPKLEAIERKWMAPGANTQQPRVKIQHLRQAAEHLKAAGYDKLSGLAGAEINRIEAEAKRQAAQAQAQACPLKTPDGDDANAAMATEMKQLRREMAELRNLVRSLKKDAGTQSVPQPPVAPQQKTQRAPDRPMKQLDRPQWQNRRDAEPAVGAERPQRPQQPPMAPQQPMTQPQ